jgi:uncharacterized membrane protein
MTLDQWLALLQRPEDAIGAALFLLVFPIYHSAYPLLMRVFPNQAAKGRFDLYRRSWIERLLERNDVVAAAQLTRNLTMVNTLLASSTLILMGVTANILIQLPQSDALPLPHPAGLEAWPETTAAKLLLLIISFGVAFAYCMTSLRHLGHFNLVIGTDPKLIDAEEGSAVEYFATLINRASNRYTLATRCLFSASPLFLWLFDTRLFILLTLFWGVKFIGFQDFAHVLRRRRPS